MLVVMDESAAAAHLACPFTSHPASSEVTQAVDYCKYETRDVNYLLTVGWMKMKKPSQLSLKLVPVMVTQSNIVTVTLF